MPDYELCPRCGYVSSRVLDVRYKSHVRRRERKCNSCGWRWFTVEVPELDYERGMKLDEYQRLAQRTSRKDISPDDHLFNAMLGLAGECGECCDLVKKSRFQDGRTIRADLINELGDCLWYIVEAAAAIGCNLSEIATGNIDKLKRRYPNGFDAEKSLHRGNEQ